AWTAYGRVERSLALAGRLSIALEAGIASGDGDPDDDDLQTFRAPQPPGRYFGNTTPLGPANLAGFTPSASINLAPRTRLTAQGRFFWRASLDDGIYSPPGILIRTGRRSDKRHVGRELGANMVHEFNRHLSLRAMAAHFNAGTFLRETPPGKDVSMGELLLNFRF
ncbi:MAG: alginate export family protein, partial [Rhizobiales bacterium]|nr:alginate export family protein [Hyphomicrobiales bacterium]